MSTCSATVIKTGYTFYQDYMSKTVIIELKKKKQLEFSALSDEEATTKN